MLKDLTAKDPKSAKKIQGRIEPLRHDEHDGRLQRFLFTG